MRGDKQLRFRDMDRLQEARWTGAGSSFVPSLFDATKDLPTVPGRIYRQMKAGKYVDFDALLSALEGVRTKKGYDISLKQHATHAGPTLQYTPRIDSAHTVRDLRTWLRAWTVFLEISTYFHPHLTQGLIQYQGVITRFSSRFSDHAWLRYDTLFRQKVALHPAVPWGGEDSRLFYEVLVGNEQLYSKAYSGSKSSSLICFSCEYIYSRQ